jgi:predicted flap endonuclease-1-like 5' DNA nuclease
MTALQLTQLAFRDVPEPERLAPHHTLPLSKLRDVPLPVRVRLKRQRINTCGQLLAAASRAPQRARLAVTTGLDPQLLLQLVRRADLARISGIGTVFGLMLEELGVLDVEHLAGWDAVELHARLRAYNLEERLARRSPTPEEVAEWVATARLLPVLVTAEQPVPVCN